MSQRPSGYARQAGDVYETPDWVTLAVVPYLRQHCSCPWDPANGPRSKIIKELRESGFGARAVATSDDFIARTSLPHLRIDSICTNPPYGVGGRLACRFIVHAIELVPVVAMLLRVDFDSGKTRVGLFRDCPAFDRKIVLLDRIVWFEREGAPGPSENHAWYIWNAKHRGPPTISYARRPS
jgi:hypothetical protein